MSHLKRSRALNTRCQSTPPSDSAPLQSALTGGRDGGTITGGVEPGGSGRWLMDIEGVPPRAARGVASQNCVSSSHAVWQVRYRAMPQPLCTDAAIQCNEVLGTD